MYFITNIYGRGKTVTKINKIKLCLECKSPQGFERYSAAVDQMASALIEIIVSP